MSPLAAALTAAWIVVKSTPVPAVGATTHTRCADAAAVRATKHVNIHDARASMRGILSLERRFVGTARDRRLRGAERPEPTRRDVGGPDCDGGRSCPSASSYVAA